MKKTIFLVIMLFVLFSCAVAAYEIGTFMSNSGFMGTNPYNETICTFVDVGVLGDDIQFYFSCSRIYKISASQYYIDEAMVLIEFNKTEAYECIAQYGVQNCWNYLIKPSVLTDIRFIVSQIREDIERKRQNVGISVLNASQLPITIEEINF